MQSIAHIQGKPCKHGHEGLRYKKGRACVPCSLEHARHQSKCPAHKAKRSEYFKRFYAKEENRERSKAQQQAWHKSERGKISRRKRHLKEKYGLTPEAFEAMVRAQNNQCAICKKSGSSERSGVLSIDHDHSAGHVRELLCDDCNVGLGQFLDNSELLEKAAAYLRNHCRA